VSYILWLLLLAGASVVGFAAFAVAAKSVLKATVEEGPANDRARARVLIMGLSALPRLRAREYADVDPSAAPRWFETVKGIHHDGRLFCDGSNLPIHPVAASQYVAARELPLGILAASEHCVEALLEGAKEHGGHDVEAAYKWLRREPQFSWRQNLRAIAFQLDIDSPRPLRRLERIVVLTTEKSTKDYPLFAALVGRKLRECGADHVKISEHDRTVDAESFVGVRDVLTDIVEQLEVADDEIVVDVTSLPRPFAIAASVLTMNRDLVFTYVNGEGDIWQYDGEVAVAG
jgi:hypothetical protein